MKFCYIINLIICCSLLNIFCYTQNRKDPILVSNYEKPYLSMIPEIQEKNHCSKDVVRLDINLQYKNEGIENIILYKNVGIIYQYTISESLPNNKLGKPLTKVSPMITGGGIYIGIDSFPNKRFILIKPNESYKIKANPIFLSRKSIKNNNNGNKDYFLQLVTSVFPFSDKDSNYLKNNWIKYGFLWTNDMYSEPISFTLINYKKTNVDCN